MKQFIGSLSISFSIILYDHLIFHSILFSIRWYDHHLIFHTVTSWKRKSTLLGQYFTVPLCKHMFSHSFRGDQLVWNVLTCLNRTHFLDRTPKIAEILVVSHTSKFLNKRRMKIRGQKNTRLQQQAILERKNSIRYENYSKF